MMRRMFFVLFALAVPATVAAQAPTDWAMHAAVLERGDQIYIQRTDAPRLRGRVVSVDDGSITVVRHGRETRVPAAEVLSIDRHDSVWNGGAIGFTAGFATGALLMMTCEPGFMCEHTPQAIMMCGGMAGGFGFGLGVLFDAVVHGDHTVYRRNDRRIAVAPVVGTRSKGVAVTITF